MVELRLLAPQGFPAIFKRNCFAPQGEPAGQPADIEERPNWIWWKVKKWTMTVGAWLFEVVSGDV